MIALNKNVIVKVVALDNKIGNFDLGNYTDLTESQQAGEIVSIGELCPRKIIKIFGLAFKGGHPIKKGDAVLFNKFKATQMTLSGETYLILPYDDLVLKL